VRECWPAMARYDLLAAGYAALRRQPAIIAGRLAILRELPDLIGQRRRIQAQKRVSSESLSRWIGPSATVREMLDEQRQLAAILATA
jgi:hypothetical protein